MVSTREPNHVRLRKCDDTSNISLCMLRNAQNPRQGLSRCHGNSVHDRPTKGSQNQDPSMSHQNRVLRLPSVTRLRTGLFVNKAPLVWFESVSIWCTAHRPSVDPLRSNFSCIGTWSGSRLLNMTRRMRLRNSQESRAKKGNAKVRAVHLFLVPEHHLVPQHQRSYLPEAVVIRISPKKRGNSVLSDRITWS